MGIGGSSIKKKKLDATDSVTFCVICYENDIKSQSLACGHAFCYDCILSIYDYEESPRCPLCRHYICEETNEPLKKNDFNWCKIGRKTVYSAIAAFCCLFCYNILPMMQACFRGKSLKCSFNITIFVGCGE